MKSKHKVSYLLIAPMDSAICTLDFPPHTLGGPQNQKNWNLRFISFGPRSRTRRISIEEAFTVRNTHYGFPPSTFRYSVFVIAEMGRAT